MKQLELPGKQDAKSRIQSHLSGEEIILTSEEEKILARWDYANEQMIKKEKSWSEIRELIALKFVVSKFTAENDIAHAQEVFGRIHRINKRYLMYLHLERIDRDMEKIRAGLFRYQDKNNKWHDCVPDAKQITALAKLHEVYTYTANSIPEELDRSRFPPPILIFKLPEGISIMQPMNLADALKGADLYIDFEDLNKNDTNDQQPGQPAD